MHWNQRELCHQSRSVQNSKRKRHVGDSMAIHNPLIEQNQCVRQEGICWGGSCICCCGVWIFVVAAWPATQIWMSRKMGFLMSQKKIGKMRLSHVKKCWKTDCGRIQWQEEQKQQNKNYLHFHKNAWKVTHIQWTMNDQVCAVHPSSKMKSPSLWTIVTETLAGKDKLCGKHCMLEFLQWESYQHMDSDKQTCRAIKVKASNQCASAKSFFVNCHLLQSTPTQRRWALLQQVNWCNETHLEFVCSFSVFWMLSSEENLWDPVHWKMDLANLKFFAVCPAPHCFGCQWRNNSVSPVLAKCPAHSWQLLFFWRHCTHKKEFVSDVTKYIHIEQHCTNVTAHSQANNVKMKFVVARSPHATNCVQEKCANQQQMRDTSQKMCSQDSAESVPHIGSNKLKHLELTCLSFFFVVIHTAISWVSITEHVHVHDGPWGCLPATRQVKHELDHSVAGSLKCENALLLWLHLQLELQLSILLQLNHKLTQTLQQANNAGSPQQLTVKQRQNDKSTRVLDFNSPLHVCQNVHCHHHEPLFNKTKVSNNVQENCAIQVSFSKLVGNSCCTFPPLLSVVAVTKWTRWQIKHSNWSPHRFWMQWSHGLGLDGMPMPYECNKIHWCFVEASSTHFQQSQSISQSNKDLCNMQAINVSIAPNEPMPMDNQNMTFFMMHDSIDVETGCNSLLGKLPFWMSQIALFDKKCLLKHQQCFKI